MTIAAAQRRWTRAYAACLALAAAEVLGVCAFIAWSCYDGGDRRGLDDALGLLGVPVGIVLGLCTARTTRGARRLHRALQCGGGVLALAGVATAVVFFHLARTSRGGCMSGLGEALLGLLGACVGLFGLLALGAGFCGRRALRAAA